MTITDILEALPLSVRWRILDSKKAHIFTDNAKGEVYWNNQDHDNVGWAYRITTHFAAGEHGVRHPIGEWSGEVNGPDDIVTALGLGDGDRMTEK